MENQTYLDIPFEVKAEDITDEGHFKGYGSTFGGKPDAYGDVIVQGAFLKTISKGGRNGTGVAMLWQHDSRQPIGVWSSLMEDKKGLKVEGDLVLEVQMGREAHALMKRKALRGLSIGYDIVTYERDEKKKIRYLKEIDLWEISPVTFAANTRATITSVKMIEEAKTERELEDALREAGLSKTAAQYIVRLCRPALRESEDSGGSEGLSAILSSLKTVNEGLMGTIPGKTLNDILSSLHNVNDHLSI